MKKFFIGIMIIAMGLFAACSVAGNNTTFDEWTSQGNENSSNNVLDSTDSTLDKNSSTGDVEDSTSNNNDNVDNQEQWWTNFY